MVYHNKDGSVISPDLIDRWADDADRGIYAGRAGKTETRKQYGRPRLYKEPMYSVGVRLSKAQLQAVEGVAKREEKKRTEVIRDLIERGLQTIGHSGKGFAAGRV